MNPYRGQMSLSGPNPYGVYGQGTGRRCGDRSDSTKGRDEWWSCRAHLTGPLTSQQNYFRCPNHVGVDIRVLKARFEAQRSGQQSGAQRSGQQTGAQQSAAQQMMILDRVNNLCTSVGVGTNPNVSIVDRVAVLETTLWGNVQAGTLIDRVAALEALVG
mgnify:CR=1 FL=1